MSRPQFQGHVRADDGVGTRNLLGVFVADNSAATAARKVAAAVQCDVQGWRNFVGE